MELYFIIGLVGCLAFALGFGLAHLLRKEDSRTPLLTAENNSLFQEVSRLRLENDAKEQTTRSALEKAAAFEAKHSNPHR